MRPIIDREARLSKGTPGGLGNEEMGSGNKGVGSGDGGYGTEGWYDGGRRSWVFLDLGGGGLMIGFG